MVCFPPTINHTSQKEKFNMNEINRNGMQGKCDTLVSLMEELCYDAKAKDAERCGRLGNTGDVNLNCGWARGQEG